MTNVAHTVLRTSTAVVAGQSPLVARVGDRLAKGAIAVRRVDLHDGAVSLRAALEGVETVVLLDWGEGVDLDGTGGSELDLGAFRLLLTAAAAADVRSLVVISSAMVYGAREDNAVPLTEDAPMRPDPELPYALARAELERLASGFRDGDPRTVAILRPAVVLGAESTEWLRHSAWSGRGLPPDDTLAPRQFVHVDDLAAAVVLACERSLDGTFNVAPDGWIAGDTFRELAGGALLLRFPGRLRRVAWALRRALFGSVVPRGVDAYTRAPWVIAADRLRAEGWEPAHTSEEAFVEADRARGWRALGPRARQELSLGALGAGLVAVVAAVVLLLRRRRGRL